MFKIAFFTAAVAITTVNSLPASSSTILPQNLASLDQALSSDLRLPTNVTDENPQVIVENCGDGMADIRRRISEVKQMALRARSDAHLGPISPHGFRAMFKSRDAIDSVGVILESIYVLKTKSGLKPSPDSQLEPRFACATEDMEGEYDFLNLGYDPWERCLRRSPEGVFPAAFYAEGTAYTFLCPPFNLQAPRPSTSHCPTVDVDTDNRFRGDQNLFAQKYQVYTLLFQLVRFYIGSWALNPYTVPPEQLDWNDCVFKLNSYDSTRNPTNFEIYTALVIQQCTQEPIPPVANNASTPSLTSSSIPNPEAQIHSAPPSGLPLSATPSVVLKPSTAAVEAA